jgi:ABC-type polar amino acid transport system ATPase subunit
MLKIKDLSLSKSKNKILKGLSLDIPRQRTTLLLGKSGSGKTTLLRCIAQLETEYLGEISFQGELISSLSPQRRGQLMGFISQAFSLFPHMNVRDNCAGALRVLFGVKKNEAYAQVEEMLQQLDIEKLALLLPSQLSGGQQQRAAIARAMLLKPSFLLFDEPTSALDPENSELFVKAVRTLQKAGTGIVISSQDMNLASKLLDRVYFLEEGVFTEKYDAQEGAPLSKESKICQYQLGSSLTQ